MSGDEKVIKELIMNSGYPEDQKQHMISFFDTLLEDSEWLYCLESAGVDNWVGYEMARQIQQEQE